MGGEELMRRFFEAGGQAEVLDAKRGRWRIGPADFPVLGRVIVSAQAEMRVFSMNDGEDDEGELWQDEVGLWLYERLYRHPWRDVAQDGSAF
jgi:hypothetical protein